MLFDVQNCPVLVKDGETDASDEGAMQYYWFLVQRCHPSWFERLGYLKVGQ